MTHLAKTILRLIESGDWLLGTHADNALDDRGVAEWEVDVAMDGARLLAERPSAHPHPEVEFSGTLSDGTPCKLVWSLLKPGGPAKLVTLHFYDRP